jgi:hypothetical protein
LELPFWCIDRNTYYLAPKQTDDVIREGCAANGRSAEGSAAANGAIGGEPSQQHQANAPVAGIRNAAGAPVAAGRRPLRPFAVVDDVADDSPACAAGIQLVGSGWRVPFNSWRLTSSMCDTTCQLRLRRSQCCAVMAATIQLIMP